MKRLFLLAALVGGAHVNAQAPAADMPEPQITVPETTSLTPRSVQTANAVENAKATSRAIEEVAMPNLPTELTFAQLRKDWRRFTARNTDSSTARMYGGSGPQYEQVMNDLGIGVHFTKGDNLTLGKETYLVAYRVDSGIDPQDLQQEIQQRLQAMWGHGQQQPPRPAGKFSPRATLKLSLLNLRNLGDFADLKTFNAKTDLLLPKDLREMSNFNLRRLGQVLRQQSRWQALPLRDTNALRQSLRNQHAPVSLLRDPANNETYHLNTELAGKKPDLIGNRKALAMIYEAAPSTDNTRGVLFADWHVERIPEWKWEQVRAVKPQKPGAKELRVISARHMKNIFFVLSNYSRRYQSLPKFQSSQSMRSVLLNNNYGYLPQIYQSPVSSNFYLFNTGLSKITLQKVSNKAQVVAIYEPEMGSDGKRGAVFLDGVVRRIAASQWKTALAVKPKLGMQNKNVSPGSTTVIVNPTSY